ncbi:MAG: P1 family peptidase [Anaerolineae bacterium]|nr:P1 family peptidase [Anaerolineae bacterium]MDQ7035017.1 P1 family peptidase [Anaerolineae bacterium]
MMQRFRGFGMTVGTLPTGRLNAITDVSGVQVGHATLLEGDSIRTGVTAILPHNGNLFADKVAAAVYTVNGYGKAVGFEQVRELGSIETPILLTNTLNVGKVADAVIGYMLQNYPDIVTINPLVGECNDGYLNDIHHRVVDETHVFAAIESASDGRVTEGCVGAGTGTGLFNYKGGIGTASRVVATGYTVATLLQTNFGARAELTIMGVPIGAHLEAEKHEPPTQDGSVMMVIATDAPLTSRQLERLARRASFGIARTGTTCHHGSGDFVIAFSTGYTLPKASSADIPRLPDDNQTMNPLFQAVVECTEESVYNALVAATTITGYKGHTVNALSHDKIKHWLGYYRRLN